MHIDELEDHQEGLTKTQLKKRSLQVNKFSQKLAKLNINQLSQLGLPGEIFEVFQEALTLKSANAKNRHVKNAARLIREHKVWGCDEAAAQYDRMAQGKSGLRGPLAYVDLGEGC